jgi:hypothetical protein
MSASISDFPIVISVSGTTHYCKEVPVVGTGYEKLITSTGNTAIAYSPGYGSGWSTERNNNKQMVFDSRLIQLILSDYYKSNFNGKQEHLIQSKDKDYIIEFLGSVFYNIEYLPSISSFCDLRVEFIPQNTHFTIEEYDGSESIKIFNPNEYFTA